MSESKSTFSPDDENDHFHLAFGRFIIACSDAERELYRALIQYSKVSDGVARAIFSGTRARVMIQFINAINDNEGIEKARADDLEYVFAQLTAISTMRDHLAHHLSDVSYSFSTYPPFRIASNHERVSRLSKELNCEVSVQTLNDMTWDLYGIANHLNMHWGRRTGQFLPWRENDQPTTWLYKSPQPIKNRG